MTTECTSHVYGTRTRCLKCGKSAPAKPRPHLVREVVDEQLHERPGTWRDIRGNAKRSAGIDDVAGWGEQGDPWTGGAA